VDPKKFSEGSFFCKFKSEVAKVFDKLINCCLFFCSNASIVDIEDDDHVGSEKETLVMFALGKSEGFESSDTCIEPQEGSNLGTVEGLLKMEAYSLGKTGSEAARQMDPHGFIRWHVGLDEGV
jgi:hypothetical protein